MVSNKIVRDRSNIQSLAMDLDKLAKDKYSAGIAGIGKGSFEKETVSAGNFIETTRRQKQRFNKKTPLSAKDYKKIIKLNSRFLTGKGPVFPGKVFGEIEKKMDSFYPLWLDRYNSLIAKLKNTDKEPQEVFSSQELRFIKVFNRVRIMYSKLKGLPLGG